MKKWLPPPSLEIIFHQSWEKYFFSQKSIALNNKKENKQAKKIGITPEQKIENKQAKKIGVTPCHQGILMLQSI